jgi:hypothetical protein
LIKTKVIEFFSQHITPEYFYLSELLQLNYTPIACKDKNNKYFFETKLDYQNNFLEINGADMYIDIDNLKNIIKKGLK